MMKIILPKALEQFPPDMRFSSHGHSDYTKYFQKIQFQLQQHGRLNRIE